MLKRVMTDGGRRERQPVIVAHTRAPITPGPAHDGSVMSLLSASGSIGLVR
jgi:hypothetical protein